MTNDEHSIDHDDESFLAWEMRVMDEHRRLRGLIIALNDETNRALRDAEKCSTGYERLTRRQQQRFERHRSA